MKAPIKSPRLKINTDDTLSMMSELEITISKQLDRIKMKHIRQTGSVEVIQIFPEQIDAIVEFLIQSKKWIESDYKEENTPKSYEEDGLKDSPYIII